MPFMIKHRHLGRDRGRAAETLAIDIERFEEACRLVERLAESYPDNGRYPSPARWFRDDAGVHIIWMQQQ